MGRRIFLAFALLVGLVWAWDAARASDWAMLGIMLVLLAFCTLLLWRNLRDARVGQAAGHQATLAFTLDPGPGLYGPGTYARVRSHAGTWDVVLDRPPARGDLDDTDAWPAWVWLGDDALPVKVRRTSSGGFRHWDVLRAAPAERD